MAIKTLNETVPHGYQIIGDNLDLHVNVKHMSNENKNKSIHTFKSASTKGPGRGGTSHLTDFDETWPV